MVYVLSAIFFILGLIIGSFLNVVIFRLNTNRTFGGRSGCMSCQNTLKWYELIPVFSYLCLRGRCRNCKVKISIQYPIVELLSGAIFALLFYKFQSLFFEDFQSFMVVFPYYALLFSLLLVVAVYDLRHKIIPDSLALIFGVLAFVGLFFFSRDGSSAISAHFPMLWDFLSGFIAAFPFAFLWLVSSGRWMGLGDAKLALGIGWLLGISAALSGLVLAFWIGAIVGIAMVIISKYRRMKYFGIKSEIPFAPFLVLGAFLAFVFNLNFFQLSF